MSENPQAEAPAAPQPDAPLPEADLAPRTPKLKIEIDSPVQQRQIALLKRCLKLAENPSKALALAKKALAMDETLPQAHHVVGMLNYRQGAISVALEHYERAWRLGLEEPELFQNLGTTAWRLEMMEAAEKFFRIARQLEPNNPSHIINLSGSLRDQGRFDDAVELLRQAIYADPKVASLWMSLGTVMLESGHPEQSLVFYEEALSLDPGSSRAYHNLGYASDLLGDMPKAIECFEKALENPPCAEDAAFMRHGLSFSLLSAGRLAEGWDAYDVRMHTAYQSATMFVVEARRWDRNRESLKGKRVLLVGEQGLGDEVLFLNAGKDLEEAIGPDGKLLIACESRLVTMIARAFPNAIVGPHSTIEAEARKFRTVQWLDKYGGADLWTPMADPICAFRRSAEEFPDTVGFLPADPDRVAEMREKLDALGPGLKVGLIWQSMLMTPTRAKYFSPFKQWAPVLKTPGVTFVNLQYGDVSAQLEQAKKELGVEIVQIEGLDVKDDLEGVAALGAALDLSIGPMTASTNLAAAAGGDVWIMAYQHQWTNLGCDYMPWYPNVEIQCPPAWGNWDPCMEMVAEKLANLADTDASAKRATAAA